MGSIFKISPFGNKLFEEYNDKSIKDLNEFFGRKWVMNTPKIFVVNDRETGACPAVLPQGGSLSILSKMWKDI